MGDLDNNIFKTLSVYNLNNNGKTGVAVCGTYDTGAYNYFRQYKDNIDVLLHALKANSFKLFLLVSYNSKLYSNSFLSMSEKQYKSDRFTKRIIKNSSNLYPYIKFAYPNVNFNAITLATGLYYDEPCFQLSNGNIVCIWKPSFEKKLGVKNWKIIDNCFLYEYTQDILILTDVNKRHESAKAYERLAIDCQTGNTSLRVSKVVDNFYYSCLAFYNGGWIVQRENKIPIFGYKIGEGVNYA